MVPRNGHAMTLLKDGRVLIAGGTTASGPTFDIEIYNPTTGSSVHGGDMTLPRLGHAAATLRDSRVLIVGGSDGGVAVERRRNLRSRDRPQCRRRRAVHTRGSMPPPRPCWMATSSWPAEPTGRTTLASAEIYDPATTSFFGTGTMQVARSGHVAVLLPSNNQVLITGGTSAGAALAHAELYADWRDGFAPVSNQPTTARTGAIAGALRPYDLAFVAGGGSDHRRVLWVRDGEDGQG